MIIILHAMQKMEAIRGRWTKEHIIMFGREDIFPFSMPMILRHFLRGSKATPPYRPSFRFSQAAVSDQAVARGSRVSAATSSWPRRRRRRRIGHAEAVLAVLPSRCCGGRAEAELVGPKRRWPRRGGGGLFLLLL
jgi:hypothetical protein